MPLPLAAMAAMAAIPSLMQLGQGISYRRQAKKYAQTKRPEYEIPQSLKDYLSATSFEAGRYGMPGQGQIEARMARQAAGAQRAIQQSGQSGAAQLASIASLNQQALEQQADLGIAGEQARVNRLRDLYGAQRVMAQQEQAKWQWDKRDKYLADMEMAAQLERGGTQMLFQGIGGLAQTGLSVAAAIPSGGEGVVAAGDAAKGVSQKAIDKFTERAISNIDTKMLAPNMLYSNKGMMEMPEEEIELPNELTNQMQSELYGAPVDDELADEYGLGRSMNRLAGLYRRRGSSRTRNITRR